VAVHVERTENWSALGARNLVLFLDLFAVLLLAVGIFGQLSQLVGELVPVDLLYGVQQDYW
jgi:hypothetical protein